MAGGIVTSQGDTPQFEGKVTIYVIVCVIISAFGGLMFGYDIGISGGVTAMDDFLEKFFPHIYERKKHAYENNYCKFNDQKLQLFTSSLYLAALVASLFASNVCSKWGRKRTLNISSVFFVLGVALQALGTNLIMVICGRLILGCGVGFANQAVPLFLSEIAPAKMRGGLNICFQLFITIGNCIAGTINYFTSNIHPHGWRISLGLAIVPAVILLFGSMIICETPTSLIERNKIEDGRKILQKIRGNKINVDAEFDNMVGACEMARKVKKPYKQLLKLSSFPPLFIAIWMQFFQQFTGINAIMFYAPVLFQTMGFGSEASLLSTVITGSINVVSTIVAIYLVDRSGRRFFLLEGCVQMFVTQIAIGVLLKRDLPITGILHHTEALVVVVLVCVYVMGFAWSWGPIGWLIPSETFPLETRTTGYSFAVSSNMLWTFVIAQCFLSMLCMMQAAIFFFFGMWIVIMGIFCFFLIPETKGIPIDDMTERVWKKHWLWKKCMVKDNTDRTNNQA